MVPTTFPKLTFSKLRLIQHRYFECYDKLYHLNSFMILSRKIYIVDEIDLDAIVTKWSSATYIKE